MELDKALTIWLDNVENTAHLSPSEMSQVTDAGAAVLADHLKEVTKQKHYRTRVKGQDSTHLANKVTHQATDIDGEKTGASTVGFTDEAYIARFLNDGTKYIRGDHFVDNSRQEVKNKVIAAEAVKYQELIRRKWGEQK
ncbi:HK97 gp10 family phage protein [Levilactobacillus brevis]|uniref:HK97 gp10 family phage protein n=1 Tax=Levilactobacillus brevis TaxID=1580 RepID=UPI00111CC703|nr:HK97 gp10 family phage protein [Levilactobacillus brevis]MUV40585.1 HK97 gp10 family phage protein [Levilactobacillus brevis]TOY76906.1 head-tail connector protein [Levilactobacillus brevis]